MNEILDKNLDEIHDHEVEIVNHLHHPPAVVCHHLASSFYFTSINFIHLGHDHEGGNRSMDEDDDDDASVSDRSSQGSASMRPPASIRWDYRVMDM